MQNYFLLFFFLIATTIVYGQGSINQKLDQYIKKLESKDLAMGSFSLYKDGVKVYSQGFGFASIESQTKVDTSTIFKIGSISKLITATLILKAVEHSKLMLSDVLAKYFPQIPNSSKITIEHLLRHQSGIHNFGNDNKYAGVAPKTSEEIIKIMSEAVVDFEPGTRTEYNNANYLVLSLILEKQYKKKFKNIIEEQFEQSLQMEQLYYGFNPQQKEMEAVDYFWKRGWRLNNISGSTPLYGAGGIKATPDDLNLFLYYLFSEKIISNDMLQQMMIFNGNMGLGIYRYPFYNRICYGHTGSIGAFKSIAAYFTNEKVSFALCLNGERADINEIAKDLLNIYFKSQ